MTIAFELLLLTAVMGCVGMLTTARPEPAKTTPPRIHCKDRQG